MAGQGWFAPGRCNRPGSATTGRPETALRPTGWWPVWALGLQAPAAGGVPAGDQGHPGGGQGHLDDELNPVDPAGDTNAERVGDERPDGGSTDADQDGEPDGDVLAAGEHQPPQGPDMRPTTMALMISPSMLSP